MVPSNRQSMLFSATMPEEVRHLTRTFLRDPVRVTVSPPSTPVENVEQRILFVDRENKKALLQSVLQDEGTERVLVFTRTKHGASQIAKSLNRIRVRAEAIHGNKSQPARLQALEKFRSGKARVLVATDLASRGLDVEGITHVINYELPKEAESYVHRIGRTARAGARGVAISFCDAGERPYLRKIEKEINRAVNIDTGHPFHSHKVAAQGSRKNGGRGRNGTRAKNNGGKSGAQFSGNGRAASRGRSLRAGKPAGRRKTFRPRGARVG